MVLVGSVAVGTAKPRIRMVRSVPGGSRTPLRAFLDNRVVKEVVLVVLLAATDVAVRAMAVVVILPVLVVFVLAVRTRFKHLAN